MAGSYSIDLASERPSIRPEDQVGLEVGDFGATAETHRDVHLILQDLEDPGDTLGAVGTEAPERRATQLDDLGPAGQALDHVGALRESAVDHDLGAAGDRVDDGRQRFDGRLRVIELAPAVVRDPDELDAHFGGAAGIGHRQDALEPDRQLRRLHEPLDVGPRETHLIVVERAARVGRDLHGLARAPAREDVALAPAVVLGVDGEGDGLVARRLDPLEQFADPAAVAVVVELEHLRRPARARDVLDRPAGGAREPLERVGLAGSARHLDVALGMEEDQATHRRDADGRRERHSEQARAQIDLAHVHEHVLCDREAIQVAAVAVQSRFRLAAAVAEVPRFASEARVGGTADLRERRERTWELLGLGHGAVLYASPCRESWYTVFFFKQKTAYEMAAG